MSATTYKDKPNTMGVTPHFWEKIKNAQYLIGEFIQHMERLESLKVKAVEYQGKKIGDMSRDLIPSFTADAESKYLDLRLKCADLPSIISFYAPESVSNCCSSSVSDGTDICKNCGEHCELIETE